MRKYYGTNDTLPAAPRGRGKGFSLSTKPEKTSLKPFAGNKYPRSDWRELMDMQEKQQSSPWHHWKAAGVAVKDQKSSSWCWCFGTTGAIQNRYAQQGMGDVQLSAASVAGPIMDYDKDQGGWGQYAVEYVQEHGIADQSVWPELSVSRKLESSRKVADNRYQYDICDFQMHDPFDLDSVVSSLLCPIDPQPVTVGYLWWGHLIFANRATFVDGQIALTIVNSWGDSWNGDGTAVLVGEQKCSPDEAISISCVKPISE